MIERHEVEPHIRDRHPSEDLAKDPNYQAYLDIEDLLRANYVGQWVAFAKGELLFVEPSKFDLFQRIDNEGPEEDVFVKEIVEKDRVIRLRSPRRIRH